MTTDLRFNVAFTKTPIIHVVVRAVGAPRAGTKTLCGLPTRDLPLAAPFPVGKNRPTNPPVAANPFHGPRGCEPCAQRLAF